MSMKESRLASRQYDVQMVLRCLEGSQYESYVLTDSLHICQEMRGTRIKRTDILGSNSIGCYPLTRQACITVSATPN
jgi:hypothetical protein